MKDNITVESRLKEKQNAFMSIEITKTISDRNWRNDVEKALTSLNPTDNLIGILKDARQSGMNEVLQTMRIEVDVRDEKIRYLEKGLKIKQNVIVQVKRELSLTQSENEAANKRIHELHERVLKLEKENDRLKGYK